MSRDTAGLKLAKLVTAAEYAGRIRAMLKKGGIVAGFPRKSLDRWILLHAIARGFLPGESLGEIEATRRIGAFLTRAAPHWRMDRVTLRRALVDEGFLDRDSNGADYRRSHRYVSRVRFEDPPELEEILGSR